MRGSLQGQVRSSRMGWLGRGGSRPRARAPGGILPVVQCQPPSASSCRCWFTWRRAPGAPAVRARRRAAATPNPAGQGLGARGALDACETVHPTDARPTHRSDDPDKVTVLGTSVERCSGPSLCGGRAVWIRRWRPPLGRTKCCVGTPLRTPCHTPPGRPTTTSVQAGLSRSRGTGHCARRRAPRGPSSAGTSAGTIAKRGGPAMRSRRAVPRPACRAALRQGTARLERAR